MITNFLLIGTLLCILRKVRKHFWFSFSSWRTSIHPDLLFHYILQLLLFHIYTSFLHMFTRYYSIVALILMLTVLCNMDMPYSVFLLSCVLSDHFNCHICQADIFYVFYIYIFQICHNTVIHDFLEYFFVISLTSPFYDQAYLISRQEVCLL